MLHFRGSCFSHELSRIQRESCASTNSDATAITPSLSAADTAHNVIQTRQQCGQSIGQATKAVEIGVHVPVSEFLIHQAAGVHESSSVHAFQPSQV